MSTTFRLRVSVNKLEVCVQYFHRCVSRRVLCIVFSNQLAFNPVVKAFFTHYRRYNVRVFLVAKWQMQQRVISSRREIPTILLLNYLSSSRRIGALVRKRLLFTFTWMLPFCKHLLCALNGALWAFFISCQYKNLALRNASWIHIAKGTGMEGTKGTSTRRYHQTLQFLYISQYQPLVWSLQCM